MRHLKADATVPPRCLGRGGPWGRGNLIGAVALALVLAIGLACTSQPTPTPTEQGESITAEDILARAAERFEMLRSFHFKMTHRGGGTPVAMGFEMDVAEGDVAAPDRLIAAIEAKVGGLFLDLTAISIGDSIYLTNPFTQRYEDISDSIAPGSFFDPAEGVGNVIRAARSVSLLADETLNDTPVFHLAGTVRSEELRAITGSAIEGETIEAEIWVGVEDFLVRRLTLKGRITSGEVDGITRTITLSAFDQPVTIEAPQDAISP
ncbi:MAG: LppX_LprAFG lipoprotein [Dehalococcoidia bacterium]